MKLPSAPKLNAKEKSNLSTSIFKRPFTIMHVQETWTTKLLSFFCKSQLKHICCKLIHPVVCLMFGQTAPTYFLGSQDLHIMMSWNTKLFFENTKTPNNVVCVIIMLSSGPQCHLCYYCVIYLAQPRSGLFVSIVDNHWSLVNH